MLLLVTTPFFFPLNFLFLFLYLNPMTLETMQTSLQLTLSADTLCLDLSYHIHPINLPWLDLPNIWLINLVILNKSITLKTGLNGEKVERGIIGCKNA